LIDYLKTKATFNSVATSHTKNTSNTKDTSKTKNTKKSHNTKDVLDHIRQLEEELGVGEFSVSGALEAGASSSYSDVDSDAMSDASNSDIEMIYNDDGIEVSDNSKAPSKNGATDVSILVQVKNLEDQLDLERSRTPALDLDSVAPLSPQSNFTNKLIGNLVSKRSRKSRKSVSPKKYVDVNNNRHSKVVAATKTQRSTGSLRNRNAYANGQQDNVAEIRGALDNVIRNECLYLRERLEVVEGLKNMQSVENAGQKAVELDSINYFPKDCYSLFAVKGAKKSFAMLVFLFQLAFLALMIWNRLDAVGDEDNDDPSFFDFIPENVSSRARAAQALSLLAYVVFPGPSMQNVVDALLYFPRSSKAKKSDSVWGMRFVSFLKVIQGIVTTTAIFLVAISSEDIVDILLNFMVIEFVAGLNKISFHLLKSGAFGPRLQKDAKKIEKTRLPICMDRNSSYVCYWIVMGCIFSIFSSAMVCSILLLGNDSSFSTSMLRVQFQEDTGLNIYSGCFRMNDHSSISNYDRPTYDSFGQDMHSASIGYCREKRQWIMFRGSNDGGDPCDAKGEEIELAHSSETNDFDVVSAFEEVWASSNGNPVDFFVFESEEESELRCDLSLGDGICDAPFNVLEYQYDFGDCCVASCKGSKCGRGGANGAFGSAASQGKHGGVTSGTGYRHCKDPSMKPITIHLNDIVSSRSKEFVPDEVLSAFKKSFSGLAAEITWRSEPPVNPYFKLDCDGKTVLSLYVDESMVNESETVMVADGAECELLVQNSASLSPQVDIMEDAPIWYIDYTLFHGEQNDNGNAKVEILTQQTNQERKVNFKLIPDCYFQSLKDHVDGDVFYTASGQYNEAIAWLGAEDPDSIQCNSVPSGYYADRFALFEMASALGVTEILSKDEDHCNWESIQCTDGRVVEINLPEYTLQGRVNERPKITSIPTEFGMMDQLTDLTLDGNQIASIPPEIDALTNLENLWLNDNSITLIPTEIGSMTSLKDVRLYGNMIQSIPTEVGSLAELEKLALSSNRIKSIPSEIGQATNLNVLALDANKLTSIPSDIGSMTNLKTLLLDGNDINSIPSEIGTMTNLEELWMSSNRIESIPSEIGAVTNMRKLLLASNDIKNVPSEIGRLTDLTVLGLYGNRIKSVPAQIGRLTNLSELWLDDNAIDIIPSGVFRLKNVEKIGLGGNKLTFLPNEIKGLTNLKELWLQNNKIETLPSEIGLMTSLERLRLSNNQIKSLPSEIGALPNLKEIWLDGNPILNIPFSTEALQNLTVHMKG